MWCATPDGVRDVPDFDKMVRFSQWERVKENAGEGGTAGCRRQELEGDEGRVRRGDRGDTGKSTKTVLEVVKHLLPWDEYAAFFKERLQACLPHQLEVHWQGMHSGCPQSNCVLP